VYPIILIRSDRSTIFDNNSEVMGRWWAETDFYEEFGRREFFVPSVRSVHIISARTVKSPP
jgi:hypothetical protein